MQNAKVRWFGGNTRSVSPLDNAVAAFDSVRQLNNRVVVDYAGFYWVTIGAIFQAKGIPIEAFLRDEFV